MSSCCRPAPAIGASRRAAICWSSAPIRATLHSTRSGQGQVDHKKAVAAIAEVPMPEMDPVHGREGPLMTLWKGAVR